MKILNLGSLNIDYVYTLPHFLRPGETLSSSSFSKQCGGKGLNQSIALAKGGANVFHCGCIGDDGMFLVDRLENAHVDCRFIKKNAKSVTGHAVIQVVSNGDNAIVLHGGANQSIDRDDILVALDYFDKGDFLLIQNETNHIPLIMTEAHKRGMKIIFNPAPMDEEVYNYPLEVVDTFILNEVEGTQLSKEEDHSKITKVLLSSYKESSVILTLGEKGLIYEDAHHSYRLEPTKYINAVDTTAAGDTFIGYYLASILKGYTTKDALTFARNASEICITRTGASDAIPSWQEVLDYRNNH